MSTVNYPKKNFDVLTYSGNGSTQSLGGLAFSPDLVWIKNTNGTGHNSLFDSVRGATKILYANLTAAQNTIASSLSSFNPDGFTLGSDNDVNGGTRDYVAWCWDAGDTTVTNNEGTLESQVRSNGNFSVVKYTGNNDNQTVGHGLGRVPSFMIIKNTADPTTWYVLGSNIDPNWTDYVMYLNRTLPREASGGNVLTAAPTSTLLNLSTNSAVNSPSDYIAYCWAETPGVSSFGEYTGTGTAYDTPNFLVECGFEPAFVMIKNTTTDGTGWNMYDNKRLSGKERLVASDSSAGYSETSDVWMGFESNGFTLGSNNTGMNQNGAKFIYAAFAGESIDSKTEQTITVSDNTSLYNFQPGGTIVNEDGDEATISSISGTTIVATANAEFEVGETIGISGQGSGTIKSINTVNNSLVLSNTTSSFFPNQNRYLRSSTARHGALAVSEPGSSVEEVNYSYLIENSLRFDSSNSQYLSRTPVVQGNRKTWTWAGWVKRADVNGNKRGLFSIQSTNSMIRFNNDDGGDNLRVRDDGPGGYDIITKAKFRDVSWHHFLVTLDTTQATAEDRVKIYVNGVRETEFFSASYPTQNQDLTFNSTAQHNIGRAGSNNDEYFNGYLTDVHLIDGRALTPESFGYDLNGWWIAKQYTGSYGTNGFRLNFSESPVGRDSSGRGNTWTGNNISFDLPAYDTDTIANVDNKTGLWTAGGNSPINHQWTGVAGGSKGWVCVASKNSNNQYYPGDANPMWSNNNGATWQLGSQWPGRFEAHDIAYGMGSDGVERWVACATNSADTRFCWSDNPSGPWTYVDFMPLRLDIHSIAYGLVNGVGTWCGISASGGGSNKPISRSTTGKNFSEENSYPYGSNCYSVDIANNTIVVGGAASRLMASSGGNFFTINGPVDASTREVYYTGIAGSPDGRWVLFTDSNEVYVTDNAGNDFSSWTQVYPGINGFGATTATSGGKIVYGDGVWVITTDDGNQEYQISTSSDGFNWTKFKTPDSTVNWKALGYYNGFQLISNNSTKTAFSDTGGFPKSVLTFPTDNNFDKFEVSDVVQSTTFEEEFGVNAGDPFFWGKNGTVFDRTVDIPVIPGTSYFKGVTSPTGDDGRTEIYDANNVMYNAWNNGTDGYFGASVSVGKSAATKYTIPSGFTGNVKRMFMVNSAGSVVRGTVAFSYDGITEYTSIDEVVNTLITNIDADGPTITTDGGEWYGVDGSGTSGGDTFLRKDAVIGSEFADSPTSYGTDTGIGNQVRGNYATLNPLDGSPTLSNGNLTAAAADAYPTIIPESGDWYYEVDGIGYTWDGTRANWTPRAGVHNFGQSTFINTAPVSFKCLVDTNLM